MHSPSMMIGQPPSMAVHRPGPAASARPSACVTSSGCSCAPRGAVGRRLEAAQTALVVAECTVWKRPPSMRSSTRRCPPASVIATEMAIPAALALSTAVAAIFFAPAWVSRLLFATYMISPSHVLEFRRPSNLDQGIGTAGGFLDRQRHIVDRCAAGRAPLVTAVVGMPVDDGAHFESVDGFAEP